MKRLILAALCMLPLAAACTGDRDQLPGRSNDDLDTPSETEPSARPYDLNGPTQPNS
jgi:hypothetical protein